MTTISLASDFGTSLSSRTTGARLRASLEAAVSSGGRVAVDFSAVESMSESFADEAFAVLIDRRGADWFRTNVAVVNIPAHARETLLRSILERRVLLRAKTG